MFSGRDVPVTNSEIHNNNRDDYHDHLEGIKIETQGLLCVSDAIK